MNEPKIERTSREIIEGKLLAAIEDEGQVAILATHDDLLLIVNGVGHLQGKRAQELYRDLRRLLREAFGE